MGFGTRTTFAVTFVLPLMISDFFALVAVVVVTGGGIRVVVVVLIVIVIALNSGLDQAFILLQFFSAFLFVRHCDIVRQSS